MKLLQAARISGVVLASAGMALGVACAFLAWKHASLPGYVAATVLLLGCPAIAMTALLATPPALPPDDGSSTDRELAVLRLVRAHVCAAAAYAVVLGFCQLAGVMGTWRFTVFYTVAVMIALAGYLPWLARAERRLLERRERAHRARQEIRRAAHWSGG